ncbi:unnamed protein product [Meloidogyne enterolobii]|uniref:Uncharacterized protein n=1 Tax=Meloidogyne enterolobii TaxID=390850 RepID=A0ACB1AC20_MELEN
MDGGEIVNQLKALGLYEQTLGPQTHGSNDADLVQAILQSLAESNQPIIIRGSLYLFKTLFIIY